MNDMNYNPGGDAINWNDKWNYPIQWIQESEFARRRYGCELYRVRMAMLGRPSKNLYKEEMTSNLEKISDAAQKDAYKKACLSIPQGEDFTLVKAVEARANQMSGGVDQYEYQIDDPYGIIEDDTEALLATTCKQDYINNHLDRKAEIISNDLTEAGICALLVKYDCCNDKNLIYRINPKNIWFDTMYASTGTERFRGYSTMISWEKVKEMIKADGDEVNLSIKAPDRSIFANGEIQKGVKYANRKIRTLNGLDIYVEDLNRLAASSQLQANVNGEYIEYMHDVWSCYNLNYYQSLATDTRARTNSGYNGQDVELTVIYDLDKHIEFKILNRRYVISMNSKAFHRNLLFSISDPRNGEIHNTLKDFYLGCPLKFVWEKIGNKDLAPIPVSPLMSLLDTHDKICALRAKREHVTNILSILRLETNAADAASLRGVFNIMGVVLDDIQGDINTINLAYDYAPLDSQIEYYQELIKKRLNAYDEFDALQAMGDRASAAESGMALNAVAQGLATHQNAVMEMYAEVARQCIANRVAYSARQEFPIVNHGDYSSVTIQQMALTAVVSVKPALAKKVQEKILASNAITAMGAMGQFLNPDGKAELLVLALMGTVPRKMARSFINEGGASQEEIALATQEAQNTAQMLQQNQQAYQQNPIPYETQNVMENYSPEQVDAIIGTMMEDQGLNSLSELDEEELPAPEEESQPITMTPEAAGYNVNQESLI